MRICDKTFTSRRPVRQHVKTVHDKIRSFNCTQCDKTFTHNYNLLVHIKTVHDKIRSFNCTQCDKIFTHNCNLPVHVKLSMIRFDLLFVLNVIKHLLTKVTSELI